MNDFNQRYLDFCKPFIAAIKEVYSTMIMEEISPGKPSIKKGLEAQGDYSAIMGINGKHQVGETVRNFRGNLVLSWPLEAYLKTAGNMLDEEYTEINEEIDDVGMEICNMTMGNAKKVLAEAGYKIEMSIPTSVKGKNYCLQVEKNTITIVTPFESNLGKFFIEISYVDSQEE